MSKAQTKSKTSAIKPAGKQKSVASKASATFVQCLESEGATHIFGVTGEENADFMMSLLDSNIEFVLCRHEQAAAFIADVYGRLTGKAGVCLATLGPGATNLVTGLADVQPPQAVPLAGGALGDGAAGGIGGVDPGDGRRHRSTGNGEGLCRPSDRGQYARHGDGVRQ